MVRNRHINIRVPGQTIEIEAESRESRADGVYLGSNGKPVKTGVLLYSEKELSR
jgi:hypothetical protein